MGSGQHGKYGYASVCGGGSTWMQQLVAMEYGIAVERRENENHVRARTRAHEAVIAEAAKAAKAGAKKAATAEVPASRRRPKLRGTEAAAGWRCTGPMCGGATV